MWKPFYNLGKSRAGGINAPDGWHAAVEVDGELYVPGQSNGKTGSARDKATVQAECDELNTSVFERRSS